MQGFYKNHHTLITFFISIPFVTIHRFVKNALKNLTVNKTLSFLINFAYKFKNTIKQTNN